MERCTFVAENFIINIQTHLLMVEANYTFRAWDMCGLNMRTKVWHLKHFNWCWILVRDWYFTKLLINCLNNKVLLNDLFCFLFILKSKIIFEVHHSRVWIKIAISNIDVIRVILIKFLAHFPARVLNWCSNANGIYFRVQ